MHIFDTTDVYFNNAAKTHLIRTGWGANELELTYVCFMREAGAAALKFALDYLKDFDVKDVWALPEGTLFEKGEPILAFRDDGHKLMLLEANLLQTFGEECIALKKAQECNNARLLLEQKLNHSVKLFDFHNRHAPSPLKAMHYAYCAQLAGFDGTSFQTGAKWWGPNAKAKGTTPHVMFGMFDNIVDAMKAFKKANPDVPMIPLVDFWGREISDALALWEEFGDELYGVRLDTHGGRYAEGCGDSDSYLREKGVVTGYSTEYSKYYTGKGVTIESVYRMREAFDNVGAHKVKVGVSSGFNPEKMMAFARAKAPIDLIGTGSFLPKNEDTNPTCDCIKYGEEWKIKVGREYLIEQFQQSLNSGRFVKIS